MVAKIVLQHFFRRVFDRHRSVWVLVITKSVFFSSPTMRKPSPVARISSNAGCFTRLPAKDCGSDSLASVTFTGAGYGVNLASSSLILGSQTNWDSEFFIGSGRIRPSVLQSPLRSIQIRRRASTMPYPVSQAGRNHSRLHICHFQIKAKMAIYIFVVVTCRQFTKLARETAFACIIHTAYAPANAPQSRKERTILSSSASSV